MKIDYLIVGAGFFGATCARLLHDAGKSVLVVERNNYIGGHAATETKDEIVIHRFGPHVFHTNNTNIWNFVNKFGTFNQYQLKVKVNYKDRLYSFPINLLTLSQVFGVTTPAAALEAIQNDIVPNTDPANFEEAALANVGKTLYEIFYKGYTTKQWGQDPKQLPKTIFNRLPIRLNHDDGYFLKHRCQYQGIPIDGYTPLIENMLKGIPVLLNTDVLGNKDSWKTQCQQMIYSGPIDAFFDYEYGKLEYRSLKFEIEKHDINDYQGSAVINYTDINVPYTRITEHKHFNWQEKPYTYISKEYPADYNETNEPYYPVNSLENAHKLQQYLGLVDQTSNVLFGGRLGTYRYMDMDETIEAAMKLVKDLI